MEKLINELCARTGIDRPTAEKVANFLKENATKLPELLGEGGVGAKIGQVLGSR